VRGIDDLVAHYLDQRRAESVAVLFAQYLRTHLSPFTAPEKVRMVYGTLVYLVLFNSVYFSLVVIDQEETKKVWLRYVMDCVGMVSILFFLHFNYLSGAPAAANQPNININNINGVGNNNGGVGNNNNHRNYGLLLIGHAVLYFALLFAWIVLQPSTFFDPSLRLSHDDDAEADFVDADFGIAGGNDTADESSSGVRLVDLDAVLLEQAARDPYALHSLKVVSLLMCVSFVEYALIALGLTARRLVGIYRIWLNTGTGHFVVHDIAEPADDVAPPVQDRGDGEGERPEVEEEDEHGEALRRRPAAGGLHL
jgi:hypothetical protein